MVDRNMNRWMIIVVVCGVLGGGYGLARLSAGDAEAKLDFDRKTWTSETRIYEEDAPRRAMIDAVLARLGPGMSREAVTELLGPPTDTPYFRDHNLVYWLGQGGNGLSVDSAWLLVDFEDGGLVSARVAED